MKTAVLLLALFLGQGTIFGAANDGVFVRFRLNAAAESRWFVKVGGYIHRENWHLPSAVWPEGADKKAEARLPGGAFSDWFDIGKFGGKNLHGRLNRAGGIAEFPNITVEIRVEPAASHRDLQIELATERDPNTIVKRWHERFEGDPTSFLVSTNLVADGKDLESATEMTQRRMKWALAATGGTRHAPKELLLQTQLWGPQRPELNFQEAKILSLLGFNVVGNVPEKLRDDFPELGRAAASHDVPLGPEVTRQQVTKAWDRLAKGHKEGLPARTPYNFQDEIACRPPIGKNTNALRHFHAWLKERNIAPERLGASRIEEVVPIESPDVLKERMKENEPAARRIFYYTSRFRQHAATERLLWNTEEFHRRFGPGPLTSTLVADHPYFGGTGLGMGMETQNNTWGGWPLALDWFDVGRRRAVDFIGVEDWMGLQFMYGANYTWEGFQLMGFQSAIFRSGSAGTLPIMAWITPSDERNLRLKAASALCQGAKHIYYWCYGPTATSTENYWSDQPGSYPGMAHLSRLLEFGESIIAPGTNRPTRIALLYSISSDLWQPFDYIHMLERRGLYLSLIHDQWLVDMLTEEDIAAGRLTSYDVLYTADPCISTEAVRLITNWVKQGGTLVGTCAAGSRNEFGEPVEGLEVFGVARAADPVRQKGDYRTRGRLNDIPHLDRMEIGNVSLGAIGLKEKITPGTAKVIGAFEKSKEPAVTENRLGSGRAVYFAGTPGISYIKDAKFVPSNLAEKWPAEHRSVLNQYAAESHAAPLLKSSHPVVETGIFESERGCAVLIANFTYQRIEKLDLQVPMRGAVKEVRSLEHGTLKYRKLPVTERWGRQGYEQMLTFTLPLGLNDLVLIQR